MRMVKKRHPEIEGNTREPGQELEPEQELEPGQELEDPHRNIPKKTKKFFSKEFLADVTERVRRGGNGPAIANDLGISYDVWRQDQVRHPELKRAVELGDSMLKNDIFKKQISKCLAGDKTMLVWLGKVVLKQTEISQDQNQNQSNVVLYAAPKPDDPEYMQMELKYLRQLERNARKSSGSGPVSGSVKDFKKETQAQAQDQDPSPAR